MSEFFLVSEGVKRDESKSKSASVQVIKTY
jgi:hypothetical protein